MDFETCEPEIQVPPERPSIDSSREIDVRGRNDSRANLDIGLSANFADLTKFKRPQQLSLYGGRHIAHFIQEKGPITGKFQQAGFVTNGAGKRSTHMAEQLRLKEALSQGRAVQ